MIKSVIIGYGNIGKSLEKSIVDSEDFELCGIVKRNINKSFITNLGTKVSNDISDFYQKPDVAFLATPTRTIQDLAIKYLNMGISTVDSFDIHNKILDLKINLDIYAKKNNCVSIISAGWDPGIDSIIRCMFHFMAPKGITYTNFGPGMSMGHSTAVKNMAGVKDALSITVPKGHGMHKRMVYIILEDNYDFNEIEQKIKNDDYFKNDETYVFCVDNIDQIKDMGHGVTMTRKGVSSSIDNQMLHFDMRINNPAVTAQVMLASARCIKTQPSGAYTLIELPIINFMDKKNEDIIKKFV